MSGVHDPPRQGCCSSTFRKIVKCLVVVATLIIIFCMVISGFDDYDFGAMIAVQIVSYAVIACLYLYTSSDRAEKIISGIFLGLLAVVIVTAAPSVKGTTAVIVISVCNLVALSVYCLWKICALVQACLGGLRARGAAPAADAEAPHVALAKHGAAPAADAEAPLAAPEKQEGHPLQLTTFHIDDWPRKFSYDEIRAVTANFERKVGRGGSAEVFRGRLDDGRVVAVKRMTSANHVAEEDFRAEITIVANVHHRGLVRLLGYCRLHSGDTGNSQYLVYPFFENGSLDCWLFNGEEKRRLLPWPTRRRIAIDVARALAYLHHECHKKILHLDIKPANILLDGDLRAHVSDFGISMSVALDLTSVDNHGKGTPGYMAPEMYYSVLSTKSDVYSYGMTLLELVVGHRSIRHGNSSSSGTSDKLQRTVWEKMARGELMEVVDAAMAHVDEAEVEVVVKVALCCVQHQRDIRPDMPTVVEMLEGRVAADLPPKSCLSAVNLAEPLP